MSRAVVRRIGNSFGIVLPKELVREKNLHEGDEVELKVEKANTVASVFGALKGHKLSADELNRLADEGEDLA
jgi:putative addiction module antidote